MKIFELFGTVALEGAEKVNKAVEELGKKAEILGAKLEKIGDKVEKLGSGIKPASVALTALGAVFGLNTREAGNFEEQMLNVRAITQASQKDYEKLSKKARELGASTKFSAQEAGEGMESLGSAGWNTGQIMDGITPILELAEATTTDLGVTADIVSGNIAAFGLEARETGRVTDVLANAANISKVNVVSLGESLKYSAPMANALGMSIEETTAMIGIFANSNIGASQAGTTMNAVLRDLTKLMSKESAPEFERLGIKIFDLQGKMKPMSEIINLIANATKNMTDEQKSNLLQSGFQTESLLGLNVLLKQGGDVIEDYTEKLNNSTGAVKSMLDVIKQGLNYQLIAFKSAVSEVSIKMGEALLPIMKDHVIPAMYSMLGTIEKLVNWFSGLSEGTQILILKFGTFFALLGPGLMLLGGLISSLGFIATTIGTVIGWVNGIIIAFGAMGTATAGASTALTVYSATAGSARVAFLGLQASVLSTIGVILGIAAIGTVLIQSWKSVQKVFSGIWDLIALHAENANLRVRRGFNITVEFVLTAINEILKSTKVLSKLPLGIGEKFKELSDTVQFSLNNYAKKTDEINNKIESNTASMGSAFKLIGAGISGIGETAKKDLYAVVDYVTGFKEKVEVTADTVEQKTDNLVNSQKHLNDSIVQNTDSTNKLVDAQGNLITSSLKEGEVTKDNTDKKESKTDASEEEKKALEREKKALDELVKSYEKESEINSISIDKMKLRQEEIDKELSNLDKNDKSKKNQIKLLEDEKKALDKTIISLENKKTANDTIIESLRDGISPLEITINQLEKQKKAIDDSLDFLEKQGISSGKNVENLRVERENLEKNIASIKSKEKITKDLAKQIANGTITQEQAIKLLDKEKISIEEITNAINQYKENIENLPEPKLTWQSQLENFWNKFLNSGSKVGNFLKSFQDKFKKTMEDIQKFTDKNPLVVKVAKMTSGAIGKVAKEIGDTMQGILDTVLGKMNFGNVFQSLFKGDIAGTFKNLFGGIIGKSEEQTKTQLASIEEQRKAELEKVGEGNQAEVDAINAKYDLLKAQAENSGFSGLMKRFNDSFEKVITKLMPVFNSLFIALDPMIEPMTQILQILALMLIEILKPMTPLLIKLMEIVGELLQALFPVIEPLMELAVVIIDLVLGVIRPFIPVLRVVAELFGALIRVLKPIFEPFAKLFDAISPLIEPFTKLAELVGLLIKPIEWIVDMFSKITGGVGNVVSGVGGFIGDAVGGVVDFVGGVIGGIGDFFGFANGGLVTGPTNALIGEAGYPEAVIPLKSDVLSYLGQQIAMATPSNGNLNTNSMFDDFEVSSGNGGDIIINLNGDNLVIDDISLQRFARQLFPKLEAERKRRGE